MPRKRLTADARRAEIVDAAGRAIVAEGVHAFTLRHVAQQAGISQPLVSAHFATRTELIAAAFAASDRRAYDIVVAVAAEAPDGRSRVLAHLQACLSENAELAASWELWHQVWSLGRFSPDLYERVRDRQRSWVGLIAAGVREGHEDGSVHASVDPERTGLLLVTVLDGIAPAVRYHLVELPEAQAVVAEAAADALRAEGGDDVLHRPADARLTG